MRTTRPRSRGRDLVRLFLLVLLTGGCASTGAYKIKELEQAIAQGTQAVEKLCLDKKISGACALSGKDAKSFQTLPVMQSVSSNSQARIVILAPKRRDLRYYVIRKDGVKNIVPDVVTGPGLDKQIDQLEIFDLAADQEYKLVVIGPNAELWDQRKFRALDLKKKRARFALVSCMDDALTSVQKQIWPELLAQTPDAIVFAGDNTYADRANGKSRPITAEEQLWERYADSRSELELFKANPLIPVVATWDDHDYGINDGDRTFTFKNQASSVFYAFFPQKKPAPGFEKGPGVASWWTAFGVQFALLDDRTFRSPNKADLADQTHFGEDQELWLKEGLAAAKTPIFLLSGDQFFGGYHNFESYEGSHPKSFKTQVARWRKFTSAPIVFLSGDRHLSEIIKVPQEHLGYTTYEITSSGLHAKVYAQAFEKAPSPHQLSGKAGEYNYSLIEIMDATKGRLQLDVTAFGLGKKVIYQNTLTVKR